MIGKIGRMSQREGLSERQIARKTGLSRNTVAKWLRVPRKEERTQIPARGAAWQAQRFRGRAQARLGG